jgi:hypothetical protein
MEKNLSFSQILDALSDLVEDRKSGTLYIRSSCNHAITIGLESGQIFALFYGPKRGRSAIELFSRISSGSYRLEATPLAGIAHDLPPTKAILDQLRAKKNQHLVTSIKSAAKGFSGRKMQERRDKISSRLKGLLAQHLGPIADLVFDEAVRECGDFCETPDQYRAFINKLALDIENKQEVEAFRSNAYEVFTGIIEDENG